MIRRLAPREGKSVKIVHATMFPRGTWSARALVLALLLPLLLPMSGCRGSRSYQPYVGLDLDFRAGDFSRDSLTGIAVDAQHGQADVHLGATDWSVGQASTVYGTAPDRSGTLESAPLNATHPFDQAIASWDAQTPTGTWLQVELRAYRPDSSRWTKYYTMAVWASGSDTILRHSVDGQADGDGNVVTDTLALAGGPVYTRYQYRLTLVTVDPTVSPHVRLVGVMTSNSQRETVGAGTPSNHRAWGTDLSVPPHSQMLYPNGGEGWCSPTSTAMVLGYWGYNVAVPDAAAATYDASYKGTGNWTFNTAFAATYGLETYVTRLGSMTDVEDWVTLGIPVVISVAFAPGELPGAPIPSSDGHLLVVRGFDVSGNVITNDPAAASDAAVRVVYDRATLERLWLASSGGTVYLIYPQGHAVPGVAGSGSTSD